MASIGAELERLQVVAHKQMTRKKNPKKKDKIESFIENFENRKRYPTLTAEILKKIPDDKLEQAIMDFIDCYAQRKGVSEHDVIKTLSPGFIAIYTTWWVEAEVVNGGFNQYFFNSSGSFASEAVAGFDLIGTPALARLMERAIAINRENQEKNKKLNVPRTLEAFSKSYKGNRLNKLDDEFYAQMEGLWKTRVRFIRANPHLFIGQC
jgi:hypothetical protein